MNDKIWPGGKPVTGQQSSRTRSVSERDIALFTEIRGDRNPIHYDEGVAAATTFGGIVVQGGVTTAILNAVVAEDLPGPGTVFLNVNWDFKAPVRPGDTITGEVTVTKIRDDKPISELQTRVLNSDGGVVLEGTAVCYTMPLPSPISAQEGRWSPFSLLQISDKPNPLFGVVGLIPSIPPADGIQPD